MRIAVPRSLGFADILFLTEANCYRPNTTQIAAIDRYLETFLFGKLQSTSTYQVLRWLEPPGTQQPPTTRSYNYVHVINVWLNAYRIVSTWFQGVAMSHNKTEYLKRAFETARVLFTQPMTFDGGNRLGNMGESGIPLLSAALLAEGMIKEQQELWGWWLAKASWFAKQAYPFGSEISEDTTAFEAVHFLASSIDDDDMVQRTAAANLATRGTLAGHFFHYGVDIRCFGDTDYQMSYMTPLGGLALLDYAVHHAPPAQAAEILPVISASQLAMWSSVNTGQIDPRPANIGTLGWVLNHHFTNSQLVAADWSANTTTVNPVTGEAGLGLFGALRASAAIVATHPLDSSRQPIGYSAELVKTNGSTNVSELCVRPLDGIGQRVYFFSLSQAVVTLELSRDSFALVCLTKDGPGGNSADILRGEAQFEQIIVDVSERLVSSTSAQMPPHNHTTRLDVGGITATEFKAAMVIEGGVQVPIAIGDNGNCATLSVPFARTTRVILRRLKPSTRAQEK